MITQAHLRPTVCKVMRVMLEKKSAPPPLPADTMPTANARFIPNHWVTIGPETTIVIPRPTANSTPWVRYSCQMDVQNPARICPSATHIDPASSG